MDLAVQGVEYSVPLRIKGVDLTGKRFGNLTVIKKVRIRNGVCKWLCNCDCGKQTLVNTYHLTKGDIKSCGCKHHNYGHCQTETRLYHIWCTMKARCLRKTSQKYPQYGGRGIKLYEPWNRFEPFYEWAHNNGYSEDLTIDRIDNNGDYEPDNCRWATPKEQANNTRKNKKYFYNSKAMTLSEISEATGMSYKLLYGRLNRGWALEKAINTPLQK